MLQADLVVLKGGEPIVVVEAKGRAVSGDFSTAVVRQLQQMAIATNAQWAILADPEHVTVYETSAFGNAVASLSTDKIRIAADGEVRQPQGEHTLLVAVESWLRRLPENTQVLRTYPELQKLARVLIGADRYSFEYSVA